MDAAILDRPVHQAGIPSRDVQDQPPADRTGTGPLLGESTIHVQVTLHSFLFSIICASAHSSVHVSPLHLRHLCNVKMLI